MKTINKSKKGFTLIELLIVVVIIGILAAIAIPNFISMVARAKDAAVKSNMHTLQVATEDFATYTHGIYPGGLGNTVNDIVDPDLPANPGNYSVTGSADEVTGGDLENAGTDPQSGEARLLPGNMKNPIRSDRTVVSSPGKVNWSTDNAGIISYQGYLPDGTQGSSGDACASYFIWGCGAKAMLTDSLSSGQ
ncbi:MAG: type II secretion system protein [candidate division WOR-3 bacterium]